MQVPIQTIIYALSIFIPLTFTTINSELFEFPKFILLLSGTLTILTAWIIDILVNKKTFDPKYFVKNPISVAVLAVLATQLIATIFSINPYTSFWGYYSRYHQGLLTTICYTVVYFAATIYLDKKSIQKLIKVSVGTAFVISLYAISQRLGVDKSLWIQDVVNRPFSTLGQPNWLAAYLLPNLFLALYLLQISKSKNHSAISTISYLLIFAALLLTKSRSGFLAFVISYGVYFALLARQLSFSSIKKQISLSTFYFLLVTIFIGTPYTPSIFNLIQSQPARLPATAGGGGTQLENGGTESGDIRRIVWTGALELTKDNPVVGTGPETFAYTYYWERPTAHNNTSEWDYLYNKAHNEYLNIAATSGLLGLLAYLYFHYAVFKKSLALIPKTKKIDQEQDNLTRHLLPVFSASITSFAITNFFGFSVIPVYLLMTLVATLPIAIKNEASPNNTKLGNWHLLLLVPLLYPLHLFLADASYAKGKAYLDANQPGAALPLLQKASNSRPGLDLYHSALGETYALLGQSEQAVKEAELTKKLNPYHLNFHKSRAKIYLTLSASNTDFYQKAATELEDAVKLAPTDPKLAYNLGLVYTRLGSNDRAIEHFKRAIDLKPNYESPYYALTLLYEQTDQKKQIPELLTGAKQNLATYSSALNEKISTY
ncbi:O-antigen ligase family protein [Candidatus Woesebacteria bacterium]|nr:O-antigen ligase family protein [Candidatus Woesebacteria bacterium]